MNFFSIIRIRKIFAPPEDDKSADIVMDTNQAYKSVQSRHHSTGSGGYTQGGHKEEEVIYDLPTV